MSTSTYKGKNIFVSTAASEYLSMGGRDAEMTFGIGEVKYQEMYIHTSYDAFEAELDDEFGGTSDHTDDRPTTGAALVGGTSGLVTDVIMKGADYVVVTALGDADERDDLADGTSAAAGTFTANGTGVLTGAGDVKKAVGQLRYTASEGMYTTDASSNAQTNLLTTTIQNVQAKINTARVEAGSHYAALENAVNYTTDLTAQYELGFNTVNDVNFSMETAHLAKNQILQQAATAMLAQANQGQQGLLQLIT